ncbi:hypothetical protein U9M48_004721 [Paspalum notatum var. saurae]|uniref:Uncharacterized protein n=1 Tax=Paspalum notatum var. saurae TaxID=547442 RepID=A0AAQ3PKX9_PASNO
MANAQILGPSSIRDGARLQFAPSRPPSGLSLSARLDRRRRISRISGLPSASVRLELRRASPKPPSAWRSGLPHASARLELLLPPRRRPPGDPTTLARLPVFSTPASRLLFARQPHHRPELKKEHLPRPEPAPPCGSLRALGASDQIRAGAL